LTNLLSIHQVKRGNRSMKKLLLAGVAVGALVGIAGAAQAAVERSFSGSGGSGSLGPGAGQEPWTYGASSPIPPPAGTDVGWGSPGFSKGLTPSAEAVTVNDFEITFAHPLDAAEIGLPGGCGGTETGGTVFCLGGASTPWTPSFSALTPDMITFTAPSAAASLAPGQDYFVNVALLAGDGVSGGAFTGSWSVAVPVPKPGTLASLALLGAAFAGLGLFGPRRKTT
jgi:hypothetical protein